MNKQMYLLLKQQVATLKAATEGEKVNEKPADFNQKGWELTEQKVEEMLAKMRQLRENKGKRLTPQFYGSIYNRCLLAISEAEKVLESLDIVGKEIDYPAECMKLMTEIQTLTAQAEAEKALKSEEAAQGVAEGEAAAQAAQGEGSEGASAGEGSDSGEGADADEAASKKKMR